MKTKNAQHNKERYPHSTAYIDSGLVGAYIIGVVVFAVWISIQTASVIAPWWLGISIITVSLYQLAIFWLLHQYWEIDKVFGIFLSNILCLGLILALVSTVFDVSLPIDLPILNASLYLAGIEATSFSPGAVALSYAVLATITGCLFLLIFSLFEDSRIVKKIKKFFGLHKIDLAIDVTLDRYSFWMDQSKYPWLVTPQILLVLTVVIVVGLAALL